MIITFFIGNGFDINLGLKTKYSDFLEYYLDIETDNQNLLDFKNNIKENISAWSDVELMLGKCTANFEDMNTFVHCIRDFKLCLSKYLIDEQNRVNFNFNIEENENILKDSITNYFEFLSKVDKLKVKSLLSSNNMTSWRYNFVVFNYTNVFENYLKLVKESKKPFPRHHASYEDKINEFTYVHGTINKNMILGLDNEIQIANDDFRKSKKFKDLILKPLTNKKLKGNTDVDVLRIINNSKVICIFGMSIGETDSTWWVAIYDWIKKDSTNYLLIINWDSELDPLFPESTFDKEDYFLSKFCNICKVEDDKKEKLEEQIFVVYNTNMFKLNLNLSEK